MELPLNVLILEDRPADAELMVEELRKAGLAPTWLRVDTESDYLAALDPALDVILSDHSLPQYDSVRALAAIQARGFDVPFIIVSGSIHEELAVSLMKQGAADYVWKDRIGRLGQAVIQALQQKHLRQDKQRVEQALRDEQAWFRALTERIHDGILVVDAAVRVTYASPSCLPLMGYTPEMLLRSDAFGLVHPDDLPQVMSSFDALLRKPGGTASETCRARHADGSWRWLHFVGANQLEESPINGIILTYRDVTEHRQREEKMLLQGAALEAAANSILITDRSGAIAWVNDAYSRMTGYSFDEVRGQNPRILKSGQQNPAFYQEMWTTILAGKVWRGELINRRKNGTLYTDEMTITPVCANGDGITHFVAIKQDVTERKRAEESLRQATEDIRKLNAELEQKVRDRTLQLEAANRELEAFAYSVSHDLRAPLRAIDGFSQAMLEDYSDKLDAAGQDCLKRVRAGSQRMGRLIDDILQLSRMTRVAMKWETVDLSALAARVIAELQAGDPGRRVEVSVAQGLSARADATLLEVVLMNLLGNAWKFTSKTARARIEVGVTEHEGQRAFFVRDNGAGFDMAYADRLFGAFQRLHSSEEFPGTGIGLATVQRIIRRHGGQVWAHGEVGHGATVHFTLHGEGGKGDA